MKYYLSALLLLFCFTLQAKKYTVADVPLPRQLGHTYVSNPDQILSSNTAYAIDTTLYALEKQTGIQVLVVAVEQIEDGDCFDFAYRLGRENGIGQKGLDNGLVILLVTGERCIQFATGYGLEEHLPDVTCNRIQQQYMNPYLAKNNWDTGMLSGVQAVRKTLDGSMQRHSSSPKASDNTLLFILLVCCFILVPALLWISMRQRMRCPNCHKQGLKQMAVRTVSVKNGIRTQEVTYLCSHCGHVVRKTRKSEDHNSNHPGGFGGPFMGGPFFGGFGGRRGGFGGGGFTGGSFGGGDFGGGGAGSKF